MSNFKLNDEVVRAKGDYVVGRIGIVIDIKENRCQIKWVGEGTSWVAFNVLALTSTPYIIIEGFMDNKKKRWVNPKYFEIK